jgi:hypothetical protein
MEYSINMGFFKGVAKIVIVIVGVRLVHDSMDYIFGILRNLRMENKIKYMEKRIRYLKSSDEYDALADSKEKKKEISL